LYSDPFTGDSNASNDEILQSVIDGILESKIADLMAKIKLTKDSQGSELLSIKEAMKFLDLKPTTFYRMRTSGVIPEYMIDKRTYFKKSEIMNSLIRVN
jgi:predicted DNA-binding transcriptional regulator AlpA